MMFCDWSISQIYLTDGPPFWDRLLVSYLVQVVNMRISTQQAQQAMEAGGQIAGPNASLIAQEL
jgi:hypothetical protein